MKTDHNEQTELWAILPKALATLTRLSFEPGEKKPEAALFSEPEPIRLGQTSVVPVRGPIVNRSSFFSEIFGIPSAEGISQRLRQAVGDSKTKTVVLDIDSPGGTVAGTAELADEIRALRDEKPIVAQVNPLAASAAFWLASQASKIISTPTGQVGSIGVFTQHIDQSKLLEDLGVKVTLVSAGKFKVEGNPFEPLSADATEAIQERVNEAFDMFVEAVAAGRGVGRKKVLRDFGEGRPVTAQNALAAGMVDRIGTFDETIARAGRGLRVESLTVRDFEKILRDAGFSSNAAKSIASQGFRESDLRDGAETSDDTDFAVALAETFQTSLGGQLHDRRTEASA